jgi:hypothetical protein
MNGIIKAAMSHELKKETANMLIGIGWNLKFFKVFFLVKIQLFNNGFINDFLSFFLFFGFTHSKIKSTLL